MLGVRVLADDCCVAPDLGSEDGVSVPNGVTMVGDAIREGMARASNGSDDGDSFRFPCVGSSVSCCSGRPRA